MSLSTLAALLESEHDLLSVLLVRAERLADMTAGGGDSTPRPAATPWDRPRDRAGGLDALRDAIQVVREELSDLELRRALVVSEIAERLGLGPSPALHTIIASASGGNRIALAAAHHDLVFLAPQVDDAGRAAGLGALTPPSLHDFLHAPA